MLKDSQQHILLFPRRVMLEDHRVFVCLIADHISRECLTWKWLISALSSYIQCSFYLLSRTTMATVHTCVSKSWSSSAALMFWKPSICAAVKSHGLGHDVGHAGVYVSFHIIMQKCIVKQRWIFALPKLHLVSAVDLKGSNNKFEQINLSKNEQIRNLRVFGVFS